MMIEQVYIKGFLAAYQVNTIVRTIVSEVDKHNIIEAPHILIVDGNYVKNHVELLENINLLCRGKRTSVTIWVTSQNTGLVPPKEYEVYWRKSGDINITTDWGSWSHSAKTSVMVGDDNLTELLESHVGKYVVIQIQKRG
jgi:hypothetical protein